MSVSTQSTHELYQAAFAPRPDLDAAVTARLRRRALATDLLAALAGGWLLCASPVMGYTIADRGTAGFWNAVATGGAIALVALIGASAPLGRRPLRVARLILGGWLLTAPAVLGTGGAAWAAADEVAVGLVSLLLAAVGLRAAVQAGRTG